MAGGDGRGGEKGKGEGVTLSLTSDSRKGKGIRLCSPGSLDVRYRPGPTTRSGRGTRLLLTTQWILLNFRYDFHWFSGRLR